MRKLNERAIALPVTSIEQSQKSQKGVHIEDLAEFRILWQPSWSSLER